MADPFNLLDVRSLERREGAPSVEGASGVEGRRDRLVRTLPKSTLREPAVAALKYQASERLQIAVNTALALDMPLLVAGEPGTGKTQVAWFVAAAFGLGEPLVLSVRSNTTYRDLLYSFDSVGDFRGAQEPSSEQNRARHIKPGPLWKALVSEAPRVLLVDEVDKAPRDFPNDLLGVVDRLQFEVSELSRVPDDQVRAHFGEQVFGGEGVWNVRKPSDRRGPIVILTTNSERRLPEPFLRRCVFHWIEFNRDLLARAVEARGESDFKGLEPNQKEQAIDAFMELRKHTPELRKKPSTAEFLGWLSLLAKKPEAWAKVDSRNLAELPFLTALVKTQEDLRALGVKG